MRKRFYFVVYYETKDKNGNDIIRNYLRSSNRNEASQALNGLLKSGRRAWMREEYE